MLWLVGIQAARGAPSSTTRKRRLKRARYKAAVSPAGPPPTTRQSRTSPVLSATASPSSAHSPHGNARARRKPRRPPRGNAIEEDGRRDGRMERLPIRPIVREVVLFVVGLLGAGAGSALVVWARWSAARWIAPGWPASPGECRR